MVSEIDGAIGHLQTLEHEMGGEEQYLKKYGVIAKKEAQKEGEFDEEKLAQIADESESLKKVVSKVNNDLDTEIEELAELGDKISELKEMTSVAEEALETLRQYSNSK